MKRVVAALVLALIVRMPAPACTQDCIDYEEYFRQTGNLTLDGMGQQSVLLDDYALVAAWDAGLQVIDIADPCSPQVVADLVVPGEQACALALDGTRLCLVDRELGLRVIDVSDPLAPVQLGLLGLDGWPWDLATTGNLALVSDGVVGGVSIIDISDPTSPVLLSEFHQSWHTYGVACAGTLAYLAEGDLGLLVLDISNPGAPVLLGELATNEPADGVTLFGDIAYVSSAIYHDGSLMVVDIADPTQPELMAELDLDAPITSMVVHDDRLYVTLDPGTGTSLRIFDVSDPRAPSLFAEKRAGTGANHVAVSGGYVYIATGYEYTGGETRKFTIYDTGNWQSAEYSAEVDLPDQALGVAVGGSFAYIAERNAGLAVVDISDPDAPTVLSTVWTGYARHVALAAMHAYVATIYGLVVVDVSNPATPTIVAEVPTTDTAKFTCIAGSLAYVATEDGLLILDISIPSAPQQLTLLDLGTIGGYNALAIMGDYAFVLSFNDDLQVFDVSNPEAPVLVGGLAGLNPLRISIADGIAYIANERYGLALVDVRDPHTPVLIGSYQSVGAVSDVALMGDLAYLVSNGYLRVVDIADPFHPTILGEVDWPPGNDAIALSDDRCVIAGPYGLYFSPLHCSVTGVEEPTGPDRLILRPNYPNPFNPTTAIHFDLPATSRVTARIYDGTGRYVRTLLDNAAITSGETRVIWDGMDDYARSLPSGVYLYEIIADQYSATGKMTLLR